MLDVKFGLMQEIELYRDLQDTFYVDIFHEKAACLKKIALLRKNLNSLRKIKKLIIDKEYQDFYVKELLSNGKCVTCGYELCMCDQQ